jgi:sulfatase maturation enzyme AslB (radical SAM superfamily)
MKQLIELRHELQKVENIIVIDWGVSNICNYRCSYCPPNTNRGDFPFVPIEKILQFTDKVNKHYKDKMGKEIIFLYTGGEVTLYKEFITLIKEQKTHGNRIGISTNGSKDLNFWKEATKYIENISLSFHQEYTKLDHFVDVINTVKSTSNTHVNVMIKPDCVDKGIETAYAIWERTDDISMDLQIVLKDFREPYEYSEGQRQKIFDACADINNKLKIKREKDTYRTLMKMVYDDGSTELIKGGDIVVKALNSWNGWQCNIGLELLVININGEIFRSWCGRDRKIGNIVDNEIEFPTTPFICDVNWCPGGITDIMVTKKKIHS